MAEVIDEQKEVPSSKTVVDFVWDWANAYSDWSRLLVTKLVRQETHLTTEDRKEVFDYFLISLDLKKRKEEALGLPKPLLKSAGKRISLISLESVKGVNQLAEDQAIQFAPNLTVIFGQNGAGKTGYGRILKSVGFSYEGDSNILSDIDSPPTPHEAVIKYFSDKTEKVYHWQGTGDNEDLKSISIFNTNSVNISLGDGRGLIVSPLGFHLFGLISSELTELLNLLNLEIAKYQNSFEWLPLLHEQTPQWVFMQNLNKKSSLKDLEKISLFNEREQLELENFEKSLRGLNRAFLEKEALGHNQQIAELRSIKNRVLLAEKNLNTETMKSFYKDLQEIERLESFTNIGIQEIAESRGIEFFKSPEFTTFLKSADQYLKILNKPQYPNSETDVCVYCLQPLEQKAKELLSNYKRILNDTSQVQLTKHRSSISDVINKVRALDVSLEIHQGTFGLTEDQTSVQPKELEDYHKAITEAKSQIVSKSVIAGTIFSVDYASLLSFIDAHIKRIEDLAFGKNEALKNMSSEEKILLEKIGELKDRKLLSGKIEEIKGGIEKIKIADLLKSKRSQFASTSVSLKTSEARNALVKDNFTEKFQEELKIFRKDHIKVELGFSTSKGNSKIQQKLKSKFHLKDILSEGEQKAVALAEFLAELQLNNSLSPVIFDDPVNSLDHTILEDVARRLLKLSKERQVVIFTHSVLLFNEFIYHVSQGVFKDALECRFFNVAKNFRKAGYITNAEESINSAKSYVSKINILFSSTSKNRKESEVASEGYGYLRSAIELLVEHDILKGTVKRYQKNVAFTNLIKVNGDLLNKNKTALFEIFERCCGFIDGHSDPEERSNEPTMGYLKADFDSFKTIMNEFTASIGVKAVSTMKSNQPVKSNIQTEDAESQGGARN